MKTYAWMPGKGIDIGALNWLKNHASRPGSPMGEAWFMSQERRMFDELMGDLQAVDIGVLQSAMEELASGTAAFGRMDEWSDWFSYLFPHTLNRWSECNTESYLQYLVTGFMTQFPDADFSGQPPGFLSSVMDTLGRAIMGRLDHADTAEVPLSSPLSCAWTWWMACQETSAAFAFCAKYLPPECVPHWFRSAVAIRDPSWRVLLMNWLCGYSAILASGHWPSEAPDDAGAFNTDWAWSHILAPQLCPDASDFLPAENRSSILRACRAMFTEEAYLDWISVFGEGMQLPWESSIIFDAFERKYVS